MKRKVDDYARIYQGCQQDPLFQLMASEIRVALRYVNQLRSRDEFLLSSTGGDKIWSPGLAWLKRRALHSCLISDLDQVHELIKDEYTKRFGARVSLLGPMKLDMNQAQIVGLDFDKRGAIKLPPQVLRRDTEYVQDWYETGFHQAAMAYKRACHWDFPPGKAGIWLCYVLVTDGAGSEKHMYYRGNIAGFTILYDRDKNGIYNSLGHIWTASAARRRGIAKALVEYARKHFPLKRAEGPLTDDGQALFKHVWPEIFEKQV